MLKHMKMYDIRTSAVFETCDDLNISFDPSTYNGEDTYVSVLYNWERDAAAYGMNKAWLGKRNGLKQ